MPGWNEILNEINLIGVQGNPLDVVRRKYLRRAYDLTGRNTIAYYSGFLQKPRVEQTTIDDNESERLCQPSAVKIGLLCFRPR